MATLLSCATGNWLTSTTWALVDSTSFQNSEAVSTLLITSYTETQSFTPGAITIDGIAVKIGSRAGTSGTVSVRLAQGGTLVAGTEVTIDAADIPPATSGTVLDGGWVFFKFAAPVTLAGATAYTVSAKNSVNSQIALWRGSTSGDFSRALRTTTTQAPVAGDDVIIAGEHTGQGTGNDITVTMNETANTDYGANTTSAATPAVAVCKRGTLKFNDASAGNPYLRLSGWLVVYNGGTFNIGTTGTPIPRNSVAVLEFDCAADGDRGLQCRNGSTVNLQGLSRTSGKNIDRCLLTADAPSVASLVEGVTPGTANTSTATGATTVLDPSSTSFLGYFSLTARGGAVTDNATNGNHSSSRLATSSVGANTTVTACAWLRRGTGTNNRHVRFICGSSTAVLPTNGFYADFDLQAGTAGTCTALGNGTATSASITAVGDGYLLTITGIVSSSGVTPIVNIAGASAAGTTTFAGDTTQMWQYYAVGLYVGSSLPFTLSVNADTGWLANDVIAIASTTRSPSECEPMQLSANAGASSLVTYLPVVCSHSGTSPTQAEIILLTRNVKIRSVSNTAMSFVSVKSGCAFDADWVEFVYLGENLADKLGLDIDFATTAGSVNFSVQNCSFHDFEDGGINLRISSSTAVITTADISNNVLWNCMQSAGTAAINISSSLLATNWKIDNNIVMRTQSNPAYSLNDIGGVFTNNTAIGAATSGLNFNETSGAFGNFSNLVTHSNGSSGAGTANSVSSGLIDGISIWRNGGSGWSFSAQSVDMVIKNLVAFGNNGSNISLGTACVSVTLKAPVLNSETGFVTNSGITTSVIGSGNDLRIEDGDFSTVSGNKIAHTSDIQVSNALSVWRLNLYNTKLGAASEINAQTNMSSLGYVSSQKHDQTAGNHKTWLRGGTLSTDTSIFDAATPSLRMEPVSITTTSVVTTSGSPDFTSNIVLVVGYWLHNSTVFPNGARVISYDPLTGIYTADVNASASSGGASATYGWLLESAPRGRGITIPVDSGVAKTVSVKTRRSAVGDGTAYVGVQPRLIVRANTALGIANDTVLDTHTAANGTWELLSGTTPTPTDTGVIEVYVDCGGPAGWVNVDSFSYS